MRTLFLICIDSAPWQNSSQYWKGYSGLLL